jgi:hypothetical protein
VIDTPRHLAIFVSLTVAIVAAVGWFAYGVGYDLARRPPLTIIVNLPQTK